MNQAQAHITAAYAVVGGALVLKHGWLGKSLQWAKAPVKTGSTTPVKPVELGPITLNDWQAYLVSYVVLSLLAESSSSAPVAETLAWSVALIEIVAELPAAKKKFPSLFGQPGTANLVADTGTAGAGSPTNTTPVQTAQ